MNDLMIDLETLATTPDALILSIGAVFFDRDAPGKLGAEFYQRVEFDQKHGRICSKTLDWWMERRGAWPTGDAVRLEVALRSFTRFVAEHTPGFGQAVIVRDLKEGPPRLRIWGHGADFDPPILHSAYLVCTMQVPWGKGQCRDTRTLFELAGYEWKTEGPREGVHHALQDAKAAALAVQTAIRKLRD